MQRIFISYSFGPADRALFSHVESLVRSHGLVPTSGRVAAGNTLTPEIKRVIGGSDAVIALLTQRPNEAPDVAHPWVTPEEE